MVGTQQLSELYFVSSNEHKFEEAERILSNFGVNINLFKTTLEEIQSNSLSKIAERKAILKVVSLEFLIIVSFQTFQF